MPNYKLVLCYDGSRYRGWQKQGNTDSTIQGKLEVLLSRLLGQEVEIAGSGRTDAGVHARAQVCSFRADTKMSADELLAKIRSYLPDDIGAVSLEEAAPRFHARLNAVEKTYIYRIWNSDKPNVFERRYMLTVPEKLDEDNMRKAASYLIGRHDFTSFCANTHMKKSAVRTLQRVVIERRGEELSIALTGDGFLYNMVRLIVDILLEVGRGSCPADRVQEILDAKSRKASGRPAPPHGLILWEVRY